MTIDELVERLRYELRGGDRFRLDFIDYMRKSAATMSKGTAGLYLTTSNAIVRFTGSQILDISEVTGEFLRDFERFLRTEPSQRGQNRKKEVQAEEQSKGGRAVSLYMARIRATHNRAKQEFNDEEKGLIRIPYSPFKKYSIETPPETQKRAIPPKLMQKIIDLPPFTLRRAQLARDCFLLSFALIGMNSTDMFSVEPAKEGILTYNRTKTATRRRDKAEMRVALEECVTPLLERYKDPEGVRQFNFYKLYKNEESFCRALNEGLAEVARAVGVEGLTFYAARHTWATCAATSEEAGGAGVDMYTVHSALNHTEKKMKVTEIYVVKDWFPIWKANKKVLALFDWSEVELLGLL